MSTRETKCHWCSSTEAELSKIRSGLGSMDEKLKKLENKLVKMPEELEMEYQRQKDLYSDWIELRETLNRAYYNISKMN